MSLNRASNHWLCGLTLLWLAMSAFDFSASGAVLWSQSGTVLVRNNGSGEDILHGRIKPQGTNSNSTLYFKFRVDPISDSLIKNASNYLAGLVLFEGGKERLGLGNGWEAWGYNAINVSGGKNGLVDLNSDAPDRPPERYEFVRSGTPKVIVFKVEYVPGHDAHVTAWLNPNLLGGATEVNQPETIITRFDAKATFDEIRLLHRGAGDGWKFSKIVVATSFDDLVLKPVWQRGWVVGLTMAGLLLMVAAGVRLAERRRAQGQIRRLEQESAVAAERARIARDIHDEVGASLTKIGKLAELMDREKATADDRSGFTRNITETAQETIRAMDEIVWAINPQNDTLKEMADYLVHYTEEFLQPTGIACELDVTLGLPQISLTAEVRHSLFLVVKEALNNAVKHAAPQRIKLGFELSPENQLSIVVNDDGVGFNLDQSESVGNGLENMRRRAREAGGSLTITSNRNQGTTVMLLLSLASTKADRENR